MSNYGGEIAFLVVAAVIIFDIITTLIQNSAG